LNTKKTAQDFYSGATINLEPISANTALAGPFGFGERTGLVMYAGHVFPVWSGNLDLPDISATNFVPGSTIFTNTITIAGGPRLVSGDMGPVTSDFFNRSTDPTIAVPAAYNNTFSADGTRQLDGFVLAFDRPVDPGTLLPSMVN